MAIENLTLEVKLKSFQCKVLVKFFSRTNFILSQSSPIRANCFDMDCTSP
jgi:hypothetical protein